MSGQVDTSFRRRTRVGSSRLHGAWEGVSGGPISGRHLRPAERREEHQVGVAGRSMVDGWLDPDVGASINEVITGVERRRRWSQEEKLCSGGWKAG